MRKMALSITVCLTLFGMLPMAVSAESAQTESTTSNMANTTSTTSAAAIIDTVNPVLPEDAVIEDVEGLRIELIQRTQDPVTQEVQFELVVYSQINSDRVQVTWQVSGVSERLTEEKKNLVVASGGKYVISMRLKPRQLGVTDVLARVEAYAADGVYLATAKKSFGSFASGEVFPATTEFRVIQLLISLRAIALVVAVIISAYWIGTYAYKRIQAWLHRDDLA